MFESDLLNAIRLFEFALLAICVVSIGIKVKTYFLQKPGTHWADEPVAKFYNDVDKRLGHWLEPLTSLVLTYFVFRLIFFSSGHEQLSLALKVGLIVVLLSLYVVCLFPWLGLYNLFLTLVTRNPPLHIDKDRYFPEHRDLERPETWRRLRQELDALLATEQRVPFIQDIFRDLTIVPTEEVDQGLGWRIFVLRFQGQDVEENCRNAPILASLIRNMPTAETVFYSILDGDKEITPHRGYLKGVLRYHLGMIIPDAAPSYLVCDGQRYDWKEGEGVLFDDMFIHSAHNLSQASRSVLYIDVRRRLVPGLHQLNQLVDWFLAHHPIIKQFNARVHEQSAVRRESWAGP